MASPYALLLIARDKNADDIRRAADARRARTARQAARQPSTGRTQGGFGAALRVLVRRTLRPAGHGAPAGRPASGART